MATAEAEAKVKEWPMLFSGPMVRAIRGGRKTQTRRVVEPCIGFAGTDRVAHSSGLVTVHESGNQWIFHRKYKPGDRIWVKESVWCYDKLRAGKNSQLQWPEFQDPTAAKSWFDGACEYVADWGTRPYPVDGARLNAMFMPRWASRLLLEVQAERIERVQQISLADCAAEGVEPTHLADRVWDSTETFRAIWDLINGPKGNGWTVNPWVRVITFKLIDGAKSPWRRWRLGGLFRLGTGHWQLETRG